MNKLNRSIFLILIIAVWGLVACNTTTSSEPTPTIVPLKQTASSQSTSPTIETALTPTAIPFPSPTPYPSSYTAKEIATALPSPEMAETQARILVSSLNVRQGPGVNYPVIGAALAEEQLAITGIDQSGNWLQIITTDQKKGWISGLQKYTAVSGGERDKLPVVEAPTPPPTTVSTTSTSQPETDSTSNGKIIFMTGSGGDLYVIDEDGTNLQRLTGGVIDPVLSPDGKRIAFTRWDGAKMGSLHTIGIDGTDERVIALDIRQAKSPTWSPDGQEIIVSFQHGGLPNPEEECKEIDSDDGFRLPRNIAEITKTRFSDGVFVICYLLAEDLKWSLRRVDVATGEFEDVKAGLYSFNPAWDPQQSWRVIYDGEFGLMQLDLNRNERWALTEDVRDTAPVFSPDGKKLALTYRQHDHWEVYTLDLETGARERLTKPPLLVEPQYSSAAPAWSPDGSQLVFVTDRSGVWEIWVMDADGTNPHPLFPPAQQAELGIVYRGVNERMLDWTP